MLYDDVDSAKEGVRNGKAAGVLYMASNFTISLENRTNLGKDTEDDVLSTSEIQVWMDMSSKY